MYGWNTWCHALFAGSGDQTINPNKYYSQLDQLKPALDDKCPKLIYRIDQTFNQHKTAYFMAELLQLAWESFIHLTHSTDISPSDLFRSLQNSLNVNKFNSMDDINGPGSGFW